MKNPRNRQLLANNNNTTLIVTNMDHNPGSINETKQKKIKENKRNQSRIEEKRQPDNNYPTFRTHRSNPRASNSSFKMEVYGGRHLQTGLDWWRYAGADGSKNECRLK